MADMVLGMTKTVVEGAVTRIQVALEEEKKLKDEVQQDLVFITGEFQMMQSVLKVANRERARKNEVTRTWIRQLRDLAFDVENWVEFVAHMDPHESTAWWRVAPSWAVPRCLAPPRHLDEAAAEMKMLKARVEEVSHRNSRYNLFSADDGSPPGSGGLGLGLGSNSKKATATATANNPSHRDRAFQILRHLLVNELGKARRVDGDSTLSQIKKLLMSPDVVGDADLEVIWLWGGDDHDISSFINEAYHDPETCNWFDHRAWVRITRPFKPEEFRKTLQDQLVLSNGTSSLTKNAQGLFGWLLSAAAWAGTKQPEMNKERYLVVLEHVSDLVEWNTIRMCLPHNKSGSRIVVSTQHLRLPLIYYAGGNYLLSELAWYPDGRPSICAFYKKVAERCCDTDVAQLEEKMKLGTIISVCGDGQRKSRLVKLLYNQIWMNSGKLGSGVNFGHLRWVPVVGGQQEALNLLDLSRRMHLPMDYYGFYDGDLHELFYIFGGSELGRVLDTMEEDVIRESCEHLKNNSLVVIHGLRSTYEWDVIKSKFLLPDILSCCCVVVVTDDADVASYCVDYDKKRLVHVKDANADVGMSQGRISPYKREEAIASMTSIWDHHYLTSNQRLGFYDKRINDCMMRECDTQRVLSVFGVAGVGKSAVVKWSYSIKMLHPGNTLYKFNYYCWVEVPDPFSLEELSWRLLLELLSDLPEQMKHTMTNIIDEHRDIIQECQMWLKQTSYPLLVLDGMRSMEDWDAVNAAFCLSQPNYHNNYVYTIVITDESSVAMHCVNNNGRKLVTVHCLEPDKALRLFHRQINYDNMDASERKDDERVKGLSERIMARCGGLPKVIAAVAECYKKSLKKGMYLKLKDINDNFMRILEGDHSLSGLFLSMQSYLETSKDNIKPCIFYLPVFLGQKVRYRRLMRRWAAEGYIRDTLEETGWTQLFELFKFSMIHPQKSRRPIKFQVNGFFHEYITSRPLEDNLVLALEGPCSLNASQRAGPPGQHLTIRNISDKDMPAFRSIDFSRLRSLTVFGECKPFMFETEMRYVRVLDLEDASGVKNDHLEHVVEVFPRLKYLSLRGCREITSLPKSLGGLRQLQTLDVRDTSIATLPEAILELHKLQYVRGGTRLSSPWDEGGRMVQVQPTTLVEEDPTTTVAADTLSAPAEDSTTIAVETVAVAAAPPLAPSAQSSTTFVEAPLSKADATTVSPAAAQDSSTPTSSSRPHVLTIPSWLTKLCCRSRIDNNASNPGVEVPTGIGKLTTLQTFGVANLGTGRKAVLLKELPKLTELRRLAVCGVNPDNVNLFFSAITGLPHLNQLSVRLDKNNKDGQFACLDDTIERPPKSLDTTLKLHGHVRIIAGSWLQEFATVDQLDLEVTLQQEEDMQVIHDQWLHHKPGMWRKSRLCLKPIYDGKLSVGVIDKELQINFLEIVCSTNLEATIVENMPDVYVVKVHCSSGSSLQLSGLQQTGNLNEVWLKGSFRDDSLKKDLERQLAQHQNKPVLKVFQPSTD